MLPDDARKLGCKTISECNNEYDVVGRGGGRCWSGGNSE